MMATEIPSENSKEIKKAAEVLKKLKPAYSTIIAFYEKIFEAQEKSAVKIKVHVSPILEDILSIKVREQFPLISPSEFSVDINESRKLFKKICEIITKSESSMSSNAEAIFKASENKSLNINELYKALLNDDNVSFGDIALKFKTSKDALAFIVYNSIEPSVSLYAQSVSKYLAKYNPWEKGYCPVCGSLPVISIFGADGERFLFCSFCRHKWISTRLFCPFCENKDSGTLHYFFSEEEKEYRVYVCDKCGKYIKNIDSRIVDRFVYPPLEHVATLHLDIMAKEKGFESGAPLGFQI